MPISARCIASFLLAALALHGTAERAFASCSFVEPVLLLKTKDVVFSGSVASAVSTGNPDAGWQSVTFVVDRVWKGNASRRVVLYNRLVNPVPSTAHGVAFDTGQRYLVFAHRLQAWEKQELGLSPASEGFATGVCADGSRPIDLVSEMDFKGIGLGRTPQ